MLRLCRPFHGYLGAGHACLVLASDGLWDAVSNQEAVRLALEHRAEGGRAPKL